MFCDNCGKGKGIQVPSKMAEGYYYSIELRGGKDIMKKRLFVVILCCALLVVNLLGCGGTDGDIVSSKSQTMSADGQRV